MAWQPDQEPLRQLSGCLRDTLSGHNKSAQKQAEIVSAISPSGKTRLSFGVPDTMSTTTTTTRQGFCGLWGSQKPILSHECLRRDKILLVMVSLVGSEPLDKP
jgi:hypothetical protein